MVVPAKRMRVGGGSTAQRRVHSKIVTGCLIPAIHRAGSNAFTTISRCCPFVLRDEVVIRSTLVLQYSALSNLQIHK